MARWRRCCELFPLRLLTENTENLGKKGESGGGARRRRLGFGEAQIDIKGQGRSR
jgi:hypothetical protein